VKSLIRKRSVVIRGFKTSVSLEPDFWNALHVIAKERGKTLSDLLGKIDNDRRHANLSSAIRLFVLHNLDQTVTAIAGAPAGAGVPVKSGDGADVRAVGMRDPSFIGLVQLSK